MTPPAAAANEADDVATVREGSPWGEMSPFVHLTPGMAAVAAAAAKVSPVVTALPPATRRAAAAEPAPSDEAPDAAHRGGAAREFCCSSKEQEGRPEAGWPTSSMVSFFTLAVYWFGSLPWQMDRNTGFYTISTQSVSKVV